MLEESELNLLVSNLLSEKQYSHCRLCLKEIQDEYVRFQDCVSLDSKAGNFQELSEILTDLLGSEFSDEIFGLDAVCMDCVDKALEAQKFLQKCRDSTMFLNNVFDNLTNALGIEVENANSDHSLYIIAGEHESRLILVNKETKKKKHTSLISYVYSCIECSKQFKDIRDFKVHNLTCHGTFTCEKCCIQVMTRLR